MLSTLRRCCRRLNLTCLGVIALAVCHLTPFGRHLFSVPVVPGLLTITFDPISVVSIGWVIAGGVMAVRVPGEIRETLAARRTAREERADSEKRLAEAEARLEAATADLNRAIELTTMPVVRYTCEVTLLDVALVDDEVKLSWAASSGDAEFLDDDCRSVEVITDLFDGTVTVEDMTVRVADVGLFSHWLRNGTPITLIREADRSGVQRHLTVTFSAGDDQVVLAPNAW